MQGSHQASLSERMPLYHSLDSACESYSNKRGEGSMTCASVSSEGKVIVIVVQPSYSRKLPDHSSLSMSSCSAAPMGLLLSSHLPIDEGTKSPPRSISSQARKHWSVESTAKPKTFMKSFAMR